MIAEREGWRRARTLVLMAGAAITVAGSAGAQQRAVGKAGVEPARELRGRVLDAPTGRGIARALIAIVGAGRPGTARVRSGANGDWRSARLAPGRYHVRVRALGSRWRYHEVSVQA